MKICMVNQKISAAQVMAYQIEREIRVFFTDFSQFLNRTSSNIAPRPLFYFCQSLAEAFKEQYTNKLSLEISYRKLCEEEGNRD